MRHGWALWVLIVLLGLYCFHLSVVAANHADCLIHQQRQIRQIQAMYQRQVIDPDEAWLKKGGR